MSDKDSRKVKDPKKEKEERNRGSSTPEDEELTIWIQQLWRDDESPVKIHVVQLAQRGQAFGSIIDREDFPSPKLIDADRAAELANRFITSAQSDCDKVVRKAQSYGIIAYDSARASEPYRRYPLYLRPRNAFLMTPQQASGMESEDDDEQVDAKSLSLRYTKSLIDASQFDKEHYSKVFGETFLLLREMVREQHSQVSELMSQNMRMFGEVITAIRAREEAMSSAEDRAEQREWRKMKMTLAQDGMRTVRNMLPSLIGQGRAAPPPAPAASQPQAQLRPQAAVASPRPQPKMSAAPQPQPQPALEDGIGAHEDQPPEMVQPQSAEAICIDNFLNDCEQTGVAVKLFGDWRDSDGKLALVERGIFTEQQFLVFVRVRDGRLPVEALDGLLPDSGSPLAISDEQIMRAMPLLTEGTAMGLMELLNLRKTAINERNGSPTT
jgi:hypothetical protein